MKRSLFARTLLSLLGIVILLYNIGTPLLGLIGEQDTAIVTSIRRQGGERNETVRGRYTYSMGYTFTLPNGREISGNSTFVGNAIYIKADGNSTIPVRYLKTAPFINMPEKETDPSIGHLLGAAFGVFIICVVNKKRR
jgi:hypothetical protein